MQHSVTNNELTIALHPAISLFKDAISNKIKDMPNNNTTKATLVEIEELLSHPNGRMGIINNNLHSMNDETVASAGCELARIIVSLPHTAADRTELFLLWKEDRLLDCDSLLTVGKTPLNELITSYSTNNLIKELTNEVMRISALGQGKGEFALTVFSKRVSKQRNKGDLLIMGKQIEVKTTDGGSGRFTDQGVRPADGYELAARELHNFVNNHPINPINLPASGLSLVAAVKFMQTLPTAMKSNALAMIENVITLIFGGTQSDEITAIIAAIREGNINKALQSYANAGFAYYMSKKNDEGILYIDITHSPITTVYFKNIADLAANNLRLHVGSIYLTSITDVRLPYPQTKIVDTQRACVLI